MQGLCQLLQGEGCTKGQQAGQVGFGGGKIIFLYETFFLELFSEEPFALKVNIYDESFFNHAGSPQERFHLRCNQVFTKTTINLGSMLE